MCNTCNPCNSSMIGSNNVKYDGPNLPCTGVKTCENLTIVFEKIDEQICALKAAVVQLQQEIHNNSSSTTTSTTTTSGPPVTQLIVSLYEGNTLTLACNNTTIESPNAYVYMPLGQTGFELGRVWYSDSALTTPYPAGIYATHNITLSNDGQWAIIDEFGTVTITGYCPTTTTTTTIIP